MIGSKSSPSFTRLYTECYRAWGRSGLIREKKRAFEVRMPNPVTRFYANRPCHLQRLARSHARRSNPAPTARGTRLQSGTRRVERSDYPWQDCDAIVIRSCWDYHLRHEEFLHWIASLESSRRNLWNPSAVIRWNAEKSYLRSLENQGIPIVPTLWCEPGQTRTLTDALRDAGLGQSGGQTQNLRHSAPHPTGGREER